MSTAAPADAVATLAARSLTKRFGARTALSGVSFELRASQVVGIIGPNGAGKTTLLSMLAGALAPSEGEVITPPTGRWDGSRSRRRCTRNCRWPRT